MYYPTDVAQLLDNLHLLREQQLLLPFFLTLNIYHRTACTFQCILNIVIEEIYLIGSKAVEVEVSDLPGTPFRI